MSFALKIERNFAFQIVVNIRYIVGNDGGRRRL